MNTPSFLVPATSDLPADARVDAYRALAREMGAAHALVVATEQLAFDPRTILKCLYGCDDWGRNHSCPSRPGTPSVFDYERILRRYRYGILVHTHDKRASQRIALEIERRAFLDGFHFAFSLADCSLCAECQGHHGRPCAHPKQMRPAFHSVGIDVFTTVARLGLPLAPLQTPDDEQNWYAFVFLT